MTDPGASRPPSADPPTTYVYIDGFNLFYGCLTRSRWKWLDPVKLCRAHYPTYAIEKVYFFTARLTALKGGPDTPADQQRRVRQDVYLNALKTLPAVEIVEGFFRHDQDELRRVYPIESPYRETKALVWVTEEKRSDVNLATQLLVDAHLDRYHTALVVTNDSDLMAPIHAVKTVFKKRVGVLSPLIDPRADPRPRDPRDVAPRQLSSGLRQAASFQDRVNPAHLEASQLPDPVVTERATWRKPAAWY